MRNCARWGGWSREAGLDSLAGGAFKAGMGLTVGIPVSIVFGVILVAVIASDFGC